MIFQGKFEKALEQLRQRKAGTQKAITDEGLSSELEKGDTKALVLSALLVFVPAALLFLGVVLGLTYLFFIR